MLFHDRAEAGRRLAGRLAGYARRSDVLALGLPRGGVPVAYEVARALQAPLDVYVVRKLGVPGREELALGAIASGGVRVLNPDVLADLHLAPELLTAVTEREQRELARREQLYRGAQPPPTVRDRTIVLVDDGLATGSTMRAAVRALQAQNPRAVIVAVPVAAPETARLIAAEVDQFVCLATPEPFYAVGLWYDDFRATTDEEVRRLLAQNDQPAPGRPVVPSSRSHGWF